MPNGGVHKKYYDALIADNPGLKYDFEIFSKAIDMKRITSKMSAHRNFFKFKWTYYALEKTYGRFNTTTDESLRYLWVNHLVVDFVFNKNLGVFANDRSSQFSGWKVIARLGKRYLKYAAGLAKSLGMQDESLRILRSEMSQPPFLSTSGNIKRWRLNGPHYEHRLIGNPDARGDS